MASIGFIGLGVMGLPMAKRLCKAGHSLKVAVHSDLAPAREIGNLGGQVVSSFTEVVSGVDILVSIVPGDAQLDSLFLSPATALPLPSGILLIEMTTASPSIMRNIGERLAQKGVDVLDAPVSGGVTGAREGTLTVICGGKPDVLEKAMPILSAVGARYPLVGDVGAGKALKAVNQLLVGVNTVAVAEALALARRMGVDIEAMREVVSSSSGNSAAFGNKFASMARGDFSPRFTTALMRKDMRIALAEAGDLDLPLATLASNLYETLAPSVDGFDYSVVAERYFSKK